MSRQVLYLRVVAVVFFLSGFSALLYQVTWQRILGLFAGSDIRSATIITGAYLAGLGIGSLIGGVVADRLSSRGGIRLYGMCNLGIAGFAFASRFLYYDVLFQRAISLAKYPSVMLLIIFVSLLFPTILMGLSLPLLSKALVRYVESAARQISQLYGLNTIGAGLGALVGGWIIIGRVGYERSIYLGAIISLIVGVSALIVSGNFSSRDYQTARVNSGTTGWLSLPPAIWGWSFLVFVSGFIFVSLEILWFRVVGISMIPNAYTFAHILGMILLGDALGSLYGIRLLKFIHHPRNAFLWLQGIIVLYALVAIWLTEKIINTNNYQYYLGEMIVSRTISPLSVGFWVIYFGLPFLVVMIPSFMVGTYFPIVQKAIQTDEQAVGRRVGVTEVANIVGNTLGSILTGLVIINLVGTPGTVRLLAALGTIFVLVLLWENYHQMPPAQKTVGIGLAAALMMVGLAFPGLSRFWRPLHSISEGDKFIVAEDSTGVAAVSYRGNEVALLYADGEIQGHLPYTGIHVLLGMLPSLVHPDPQQVLVIGIGSSGTPYGAGANAAVQHIRAVELVGTELEVLRLFAQEEEGIWARAFLNDPRFEIVIGDGRYELAQSEQPFDVIEADAIWPHRSHSGLLYSREFFEMVLEKLDDDGITIQWTPTERTKNTFVSVFPYVVEVNAFLIGSRQPINYDREAIITKLQEPELRAYLEAAGIDVDALIEAIPEVLAVWTPETQRDPDAEINTDLFPRDEYYVNNPLCKPKRLETGECDPLIYTPG